ncbi:MAG TPA: hypothetical protein VL360_01465 [Gammaproteobacteria bacterium]|jgi:hypothetical protein|nr:hypothetical protein [Gammaproteobacteria bacterium]
MPVTDDKIKKQQELIDLISKYVTEQIGENGPVSKQYLKILGETATGNPPEKVLNKLGSNLSQIKKSIDAGRSAEGFDGKADDVTYTIETMLRVYNQSKKDEATAIAIIKDALSTKSATLAPGK